MNLKKILSANVITLTLKANDKPQIIQEMLELLVSQGKIKASDKSGLFDAVMRRESQMSTGIQCGVAIPHGKSDLVKELVACIAISQEGKDFDSLDQQPSHIFVMTISPQNKTGPHVQFLAEVSRLLTQETFRQQILEAKTAQEVLSLFLD